MYNVWLNDATGRVSTGEIEDWWSYGWVSSTYNGR